MFKNVFKMELRRAFHPLKIAVSVVLTAVLIFMGSIFDVHLEFYADVGILVRLRDYAAFHGFTCAMIVLLAGLHTSSFCKDNNSQYLRMILCRTDVITYVQARFLANACVIVCTAVMGFYLYALALTPLMPILETVSEFDTTWSTSGYQDVIVSAPWIYVGMMAIVFGLVVAAGNSFGILYSIYRSNTFVCISLGGVLVYLVLSFERADSIFCVWRIMSMNDPIFFKLPWPVMFLWSVIYMVSVIQICGLLFYRKMRWRVENGYI